MYCLSIINVCCSQTCSCICLALLQHSWDTRRLKLSQVLLIFLKNHFEGSIGRWSLKYYGPHSRSNNIPVHKLHPYLYVGHIIDGTKLQTVWQHNCTDGIYLRTSLHKIIFLYFFNFPKCRQLVLQWGYSSSNLTTQGRTTQW